MIQRKVQEVCFGLFFSTQMNLMESQLVSWGAWSLGLHHQSSSVCSSYRCEGGVESCRRNSRYTSLL